ncbi:DUF4291 domain-containing protein [Shimazuella sp. AN120528]|uniref:DUF4291 domain-containing protein n=1 Tax=Shimazuella soli TaxID=1892854 RepID=UPI001F0F0CDD|nr:DUF4291 domain-containing protein [Shimazuella soli]MCH5586268.1 DUF4291 domain-containing protein [Shimazuella soli]
MRFITPTDYLALKQIWPESGQHILATYDETSITVYQAYNQKIASYAVEHQTFGGEFSMNRMTWIKPNFLWMMYRSGWGTKANQEVTLAIRLKREGFDQIVSSAVHSSYQSSYGTQEKWRRAVKNSSVRLQWDPDHDPFGRKLERKAIQLGLRGESLQRYMEDWIMEIEDISAFVAEQREFVNEKEIHRLQVPDEKVYRFTSK